MGRKPLPPGQKKSEVKIWLPDIWIAYYGKQELKVMVKDLLDKEFKKIKKLKK